MKQQLVRATNATAPALRRPLTPAQFGDLAEIPPELEWLAILATLALSRHPPRGALRP